MFVSSLSQNRIQLLILIVVLQIVAIKSSSIPRSSSLLSSSDTNLVELNGCTKCKDIFYYSNKYAPEFELNAFTTPVIRVDRKDFPNLISFKVVDNDETYPCYASSLTITTNDTNFYVTPDLNERFNFNFKGTLFYNNKCGHRYVVLMTACDNGKPNRCSTALVFVPLQNANCHAPQYTAPVILLAAITLKKSAQLGILNAWDIDGDKVSYHMDPSNDKNILNTIEVTPDGIVKVKEHGSLINFEKTLTFKVILKDDGSSSSGSGSCPAGSGCSDIIILQSTMEVTLIIIEVNMHSPQFVPNDNKDNYCEITYQAYENTFFQIEIVAQDDDERGDNGKISLYAPEISDRSPQNSFNLKLKDKQMGRQRTAIITNLEPFDYEMPKYGSNTMNIMFYAEDHGVTKRRGYCFMSIEILDVNDNIPVFAQRSYTIYIHDQYKTRQFNYRFIAIDKDSGLNGKVRYYMTNDNMLATNLFKLQEDGTLVIKDTSYLHEVHETLEFFIYAEDMSVTRNRSEIVSVKVFKTLLKLLPPFFSDFPEPPELNAVSEMTPRGTILKDFSIFIQTDPKEQFLRCFLSPKPNPEWFKFEFLNDKQTLSTKETCYLKIEDPLNYRLASSMVVYMVAEVGNYLLTSTARELKILTINIKEENINPPKFVTNTIEASVVEGEENVGKVIAVVKAYDIDKTDAYHRIVYCFGDKSNSDGFFSIDANTGEIRLIQRIQNKKNIPLEVIARDGANGYNSDRPNQNSIYVDVKVIDINDNPPQFSRKNYEFEVSECAQPGYVIGQLEVNDEDTESFFNFSISDSTFGIRPIYDPKKSKSYYNYKGSAEIYLNNYLDFNHKSVYNLKVFVTDSFFLTSTELKITVRDEYNNPPVFKGLPYIVEISEETIPTGALLTLRATGEEKLPNNFKYKCYSTPYLDSSYFDLNPTTGELFLKKGLNRDLPDGMPVYFLPVSVTDSGNLTTYATVKIILDDINDNAPVLVYDTPNPLIIDEGSGSNSIELYVVDVDSPPNGPKFTFSLTNFTDIFDLKEINCNVNCNDREKYQIINKVPLDREGPNGKFYLVGYTVQDKGGLSRNGVIQIIIGDTNNNPNFDGSKKIKITSLENSIESNLFLGTLYVKDKDDWDQVYKEADNCIANPNVFVVKPGLQIFGPSSLVNFPQNVNTLKCQVKDPKLNSVVKSNADVSLDNINYNDLIDPTVLRLFGITPEDLAKKTDITDTSILDNLVVNLINILNINQASDPKSNFLKIITLRSFAQQTQVLIPNQIPDYDVNSFGSDVYFYVRQNGKLTSSRQIYSILSQNIQMLTSNQYTFNLNSFLFDVCQLDQNKADGFCPSNSACKQSFMFSRQSITTDANATSLVSMDNQMDAECFSKVSSSATNMRTCYNGGTLMASQGGSDYYCQCPSFTEGPRCEILSLTFKFSPSSPSHSFALFDSFSLNDPLKVEFDFTTDREKGLLLFNGPINRESIRFIAAEINKTVLLIHVGLTKIDFPEVNVSDKKWHHVDILQSLDSVQVILDKCYSKHAKISNYPQMIGDMNPSDVSKLSLGGIPPTISNNHFYYSLLDVYEYEGCIRNLRVNGDLRNLKLSSNPDEYNLAQDNQQCDCTYNHLCSLNPQTWKTEANPFPWWIILIIVGTLLLLALILGLAILSIRRKDTQKKILQMFPDDDIRETIINYADGAGEENTENFNIGVIKKPIGPMIQTVRLSERAVCGGVMCGGTGCGSAKCLASDKANLELSTNDQNMIYAYEGEGSEVGSLSSLVSNKSDLDQEYEYIKEWGPKFYKLSNIFINNTNNNGNIHLNPNDEYRTYQSSSYQYESRIQENHYS